MLVADSIKEVPEGHDERFLFMRESLRTRLLGPIGASQVPERFFHLRAVFGFR